MSFLLGYLPHQVQAQFDALDLMLEAQNGAAGELARRVETMLAALPSRGPEVVSCVLELESLLAPPLPAEPRTQAECAQLIAACDKMPHDAAHEHGARCGEAERLLGEASQVWALWAAEPSHPLLSARAAGLREKMTKWSLFRNGCPTLDVEEQLIARDLAHAVEVAAHPPHDGAAVEFMKGRMRVAQSARAMEAAAAGTPRDSIRAWSEKRMNGRELLRRLAEHHRWNVPATADGKPRLFQLDKRVLFAFSDGPALQARPSFVRESLVLTVAGALLFKFLPPDADLLVLEATDDAGAPGTINYPREMHALLRQVGVEVALELAATDWSQVLPGALREHPYWIVVEGNNVKQLLAPDARGRPMSAVFSSEAALEAHLSRVTPEQATSTWQRRLLKGELLFPSLAKLGMGMALNPSGPGRRRAFNQRFLEMLASG